MATTKHKAKPRKNEHKPSFEWNAAKPWKGKAQWRKWERVGMRPSMDTDDLNLYWIERKVPDLNFKGAVSTIMVNRTIEGASTITIELIDPERRMFMRKKGRVKVIKSKRPEMVDQGWEPIDSPDIIGTPVELILDDVVFRLVKADHDWETSKTTLVFEDRIIYWLRRITGQRHIARSRVTRAEFILSQLREVTKEKPPFICPQLHVKQPIAPARDPGGGSTHDDRSNMDSSSGYSAGDFASKTLKVKGATATREQRRNMDIVLTEGAAQSGAEERSLKALIQAVIVESGVKNLTYGDADSTGILQVRAGTAAGHGISSRDMRACAREFMNEGFWGKGGAIQLARKNPSKTTGWIAQQAQGSAYPSRYDDVSSEAGNWLESWNGGTYDAGGTQSESYNKSYQYRRDKKENAWESMTRLAEEVNWRIFMVGRAMYFMSEIELFRRRTRYKITDEDDSVLNLQWSMDWGRVVSEATLTVDLERWAAPPGSTIILEGFGPPDGRWLIKSCDRDWFEPTAALSLIRPSPSKREPAPETGTRSRSIPDELTTADWKSLHNATPKRIIDEIVIPMARDAGIPVTVQSVEQANARHGPTTSGGRSDHQGPPEQAWAADMSNGVMTSQEKALAKSLASAFKITSWNGSGIHNATHHGFRFQLIFGCSDCGGDHTNHVHFGVGRA